VETELLSVAELEDRMVRLQTQMIDVGMVKGLSHPDTVRCSQELDVVIHHIQMLKLMDPVSNILSNPFVQKSHPV